MPPSPTQPTQDPPDRSPRNEIKADDPLAHLLRRIGVGDEAAFAALYDLTASRTFGLILRLVRNHAMAEEVAQEVYLQVWQSAFRYDESRGSAISWLRTLAHRRAVDLIRATQARGRLDTAHLHENWSTDGDVTFDSVAATMEATLAATRIRGALASLRPLQRQALELAYFGGHTHSEIARMTGTPLGTAKTRIRDGLINLRDSLSNSD